MSKKPVTLAVFRAEQHAREEAYLRQLLEAAEWSLFRAARIAGCQKSTIQKMLGVSWDPPRHPELEAERVRRTQDRPPGRIR